MHDWGLTQSCNPAPSSSAQPDHEVAELVDLERLARGGRASSSSAPRSRAGPPAEKPAGRSLALVDGGLVRAVEVEVDDARRASAPASSRPLPRAARAPASRGARPWAETWKVTSSTACRPPGRTCTCGGAARGSRPRAPPPRSAPARHRHAHGVLLAAVAHVDRARAGRLAGRGPCPRARASRPRPSRAPRRARRAAASVDSAARRMCVRTTSTRGSVMHMPQAENTPESGGRSPCAPRARRRAPRRASPPPPPPTSRAKSRGSWPRRTETSLSALIMFALASRMMPLAGASAPWPSGSPSARSASRASSGRPAAGRRGSSRGRARRRPAWRR